MNRGRFRSIALLLILPALSLSCTALNSQPSFRPQEQPRLEMAPGVVSTRGLPQRLAADATAEAPTPPSPDAGHRVFATYCAMCHGADGRGSGPVGRHFVPPPPDLTADFVSRISDAQMFAEITSGFGRMPPFETDLNAEEIRDVTSYVRTLRR